jgi:hypothetical protein
LCPEIGIFAEKLTRLTRPAIKHDKVAGQWQMQTVKIGKLNGISAVKNNQTGFRKKINGIRISQTM